MLLVMWQAPGHCRCVSFMAGCSCGSKDPWLNMT